LPETYVGFGWQTGYPKRRWRIEQVLIALTSALLSGSATVRQ